MSDVNPTKRLYLYIRDLLNIDESANILVYGRDNDYDNETSSKIVVDTLAPSIQQSMTKTYDGDGEEMGIDSLMLGSFTINFYGTDAYERATDFIIFNKTEEARTLQKTHELSVFRTSQITDLKRLAGKYYDSRYEITLNISYNITKNVNRLRFDEAQFGEVLVDK